MLQVGFGADKSVAGERRPPLGLPQRRRARLDRDRSGVAALHELGGAFEAEARLGPGRFGLLDIVLRLGDGGGSLVDAGLLLRDLPVDQVARQPRHDLAAFDASPFLDQDLGDAVAVDLRRDQDFVAGTSVPVTTIVSTISRLVDWITLTAGAEAAGLAPASAMAGDCNDTWPMTARTAAAVEKFFIGSTFPS